jgi:putative endonuclease
MLKCKDGSFYTGITTDLARRVDEHNGILGNGARYTRARQPVQLIYQESCEDRSQASKREYAIKQLNRIDKQALAKQV